MSPSEEPPVESVGGVPTEHGDRCDAGVHAAVSWTYMKGERAEEALLRIRRALKEPRGWWAPNDEAEYQVVMEPMADLHAKRPDLAGPDCRCATCKERSS